jgi:hypothetical protein
VKAVAKAGNQSPEAGIWVQEMPSVEVSTVPESPVTRKWSFTHAMELRFRVVPEALPPQVLKAVTIFPLSPTAATRVPLKAADHKGWVVEGTPRVQAVPLLEE